MCSSDLIPLERVAPNYTPTVLANQPVDVPNLFDVALVVFSKRDAREFLSIPAGQRFQDLAALPSSERIFKVSSISPEALTNGSFEITLNGYPTLDGKVQVGDWLMMSRFAMRDLLPRTTNTQIARQVHRWYRVVGVTDSTTLVNQPIQRKVRVSGKPWNWTEGEINDAMERFGSLPTKMQVPPDPADYEIQAVLLKNVVQVYERQMDLR